MTSSSGWPISRRRRPPKGRRGLLDLPDQVTDSPGIDAEATWARKPEADLRIRKTCTERVQAGDTIRCTINVKNLGPDPSGDVKVTDELDRESHALITAMSSPAAGCSVRDREGKCFADSLGPGEELEIKVRITTSRDFPQNVIDIARVSGGVHDPNERNNVDTALTRVD